MIATARPPADGPVRAISDPVVSGRSSPADARPLQSSGATTTIGSLNVHRWPGGTRQCTAVRRREGRWANPRSRDGMVADFGPTSAPDLGRECPPMNWQPDRCPSGDTRPPRAGHDTGAHHEHDHHLRLTRHTKARRGTTHPCHVTRHAATPSRCSATACSPDRCMSASRSRRRSRATASTLTQHSWSLLANGPGGWVQVANLLATGLATIAAAIGLRGALAGVQGGAWGPRLVGVYGAGLVAAGLFRADPMEGFPVGTPAGAARGQLARHAARRLWRRRLPVPDNRLPRHRPVARGQARAGLGERHTGDRHRVPRRLRRNRVGFEQQVWSSWYSRRPSAWSPGGSRRSRCTSTAVS